jgi:hypothetical protein
MVYRDRLLLPRPGRGGPEVLDDFAFGCAKFQTVRWLGSVSWLG